MALSDDPAVKELMHKVALSSRILHNQGLADYMGHSSARVPGRDLVVVKPRHSTKIRGMWEMTAELMVIVDLDGNLIEGEYIPPNEITLHTSVYKQRPEVGSVIHTHQLYATMFGACGQPILPLLHLESPLVQREIPIYESPLLIIDHSDGAEVAEAMGDHDVVHLRNHGVVVAGPSIELATIRCVQLERLARANVIASTIGKPHAVSDENINILKRQLQEPSGRWAYYVALVEKDGAAVSAG